MTEFILETNAVSVAYGGLTAVDSVSLSVEPGHLHGIIGPNGAGKTTLFDALTGLTRVNGGTVRFSGQDVTRWSPHRRVWAGMRRSFQTVGLIGGLSVRDNILVGLEAIERVTAIFPRPRAAARRAQAVEQVLHDFGLSALRDVPVHALPFGTSKLVELAKPFVGQPRLVLLDEPFAGLSSGEARDRARLLAQRCADTKTAIVVVEHNVPALAGLCSHLTVLDYGKVIAQGDPAAVLRDPAVREAYMGDIASGGAE